jgi:Flp pilus assembly protein TadG
VEFALCLPVLFMVIFAIIEFARANQLRHTAKQAAYEGARVGIAPGASATEVQTAASAILTASGVTSSSVSVSPSAITSSTPSVAVTVSIDASSNAWTSLFIPSGAAFTATVTLDSENQAISTP